MKRTLALLISALSLMVNATAQTQQLQDIYIRDPFILPVEETGTYYLYRPSSYTFGAEAPADARGKTVGGVEAFKSKDLKTWEGPIRVFNVPADNWITGYVWAPEVHQYKGEYYLFATLNSDIHWKKSPKGWGQYTYRGTQIFHSKSPEGPFEPFELVPHTPMDWMCLDGTLYVEDGVPYMVYCHEWIQTEDGSMVLQRLKDDLSAPDGQRQTLFHASAAPWSTGNKDDEPLPVSYVTDGCFLYKTCTGKLLMIWSSFMNGEYALGIAESTSGKVRGPWRQNDTPLFSRDGGHGMIFRSFEGQLYLILHSPNGPAGLERAHLYPLEDNGDTLSLKEN